MSWSWNPSMEKINENQYVDGPNMNVDENVCQRDNLCIHMIYCLIAVGKRLRKQN